MSDLSQMIRWNANFVRGLAESVLNRARAIRGTLVSEESVAPAVKTAGAKKPLRKAKTPAKASVRKANKPVRRAKRSDA